MMIAAGFILMPLGYLLAAWGIAALFVRARFPSTHGTVAMLFALPLAPALQAWLLNRLLDFAPGLPPLFYIAAVSTLTILPLLIFRPQAAAIVSDIRAWRSDFSLDLRSAAVAHPWLTLAGILALAQVVLITAEIWTLPLLGSDPLEYAAVARSIYHEMSLAHYPIDVSLANGLYARSAHPPAYHLMIVWSFLLQGDEMRSLLMRFINLHYFLCTLLLVAYAAARASLPAVRTGAALAAIVLVLAVPIYPQLVSLFHIDPMRICLYALAFMVTAELIDTYAGRRDAPMTIKDDAIPALITGAVTGFGMYAHSIGLILLPCVGLCYLLFVRRSPPAFIALGVLIVCGALLIGGWQPVYNMQKFGVPLHESEPIWDLGSVAHDTDMRYRRELVTLQQRIFNGLLGWFTRPDIHGWIHWFVLIPSLLFVRRFWATTYARVMSVALLSFYAIGIALMSVGSDLMIKNFRYLLTILPFVAVLGAIGLAGTYAYFKGK
jgi:hypothetical protein